MLLLHRRLPAASVTAGITAALAAGTCSPDVVAVEARKHAAAAGPGRPHGRPALAPRRVAGGGHHAAGRRQPLPADPPAPSVAAYDQLLRPARGGKGGAS